VRYRPHDLLTPDHLAVPLALDKPVVLYDEKGSGDLTDQIAEKLRASGFADVRVLEGGAAAWEQAGGPTQEPTLEQVVPPMAAAEVQQLDRRI
jgi:3-mercaptopyruvate sulfurtransferase SseA